LIDGIVPSIEALIDTFDGVEIGRFDGARETLRLDGAVIEVFGMTARQQLLSAIKNPNLALVLGMVGLLGLYIEITHPGIIFPGVIGGISLILALYAFNVLPVTLTGVLLILLAIGLFVVEATVPSSGILAIGGVVAMIAGGLMLVDGPIPQLRVQLPTVLALAIPMAAITVFLVRLVVVAQKNKSVSGGSGMIGEVGTATGDVHEAGRVMVHGEYWAAHSSAPIAKGSRVRVIGIEGLRLEVEGLGPMHKEG
jgi:membrane-bound serine protease (ClpP class)